MITDEQYIRAAEDDYAGDGILVCQPGTGVPESDDVVDRVNAGAWVKAWLWVSNEEFERTEV